MAPRAPETKASVLAALRRAEGWIPVRPFRFGSPHHTHAVVVQDGRCCVRRLELDPAKAEAFRARTGRFMPEDAEDLSEPTGAVVLEAESLPALLARLEALPWPLPSS